MGWQEIATIAVVSLAVLVVLGRLTGGWPLRRRKAGGNCGHSCDSCPSD